jgi:hypothetical protein
MGPTVVMLIDDAGFSEHQKWVTPMNAYATRYHTANIDGLDVFYRAAGDPDNPALLLLHGFPSSTHMFRNLINSPTVIRRAYHNRRR